MTSTIEIFEKKPEGFIPRVEVAGCYIEMDNKLLFLKYASTGTESGKWGVPAGKIEKNETPLDAARRELFEETGISLGSQSQIHYVSSLYIRKPDIDYTFHLFKVHLDQMPDVQLSDEHQSYRWATSKDIEELHLVDGAKEALEFYKRPLILKKEFYFVRHGQTDHNIKANRFEGTVLEDIHLNETGRNQAKAIESIIATLPITTVCASPMKRAQETKEIITTKLQAPHHCIDLLTECTGEIWYGMVELGMSSPPPLEGKVRLFMDRVREGMNQALSLPGPSLIVAHGGIHWAICCMMKIESHDWSIENCAIVHFSCNEENKWIAKKL